MEQPLTHKFELYNGKEAVIKRVTPFDFLESDGPPLSFVSGKRAQTMMEQVLGDESDQKVTFEQQTEIIKLVLKAGVIALDSKAFDAEVYLSESSDLMECMEMYAAILNMSLKALHPSKGIKSISNNLAISIDGLARRYARTPAEILFGPNHTALDAWMLNFHIAVVGAEEEARQQKAQMASLGRR